jgi:hypothetical protein
MLYIFCNDQAAQRYRLSARNTIAGVVRGKSPWMSFVINDVFRQIKVRPITYENKCQETVATLVYRNQNLKIFRFRILQPRRELKCKYEQGECDIKEQEKSGEDHERILVATRWVNGILLPKGVS